MVSLHQRHDEEYSIAQCLPAEILVNIAVFYQEFLRVDESPHDPWSFLVVTRVCRLWREVIYNTRLLWTTIYLPAPEPLLNLALLHSAHLPLDIAVNYGGAVAEPGCLLAIAGQAHRIRRLAVKVTEHTETGEILPSPVPVAAPHLESIVIRGGYALPRFFLKSIGAAPQLQHLDVVAYPGFWTDLTRFPALKRLTVRRGAVPRQQPEVALVDVKAGLAALAQLEELDAFCNVAEEGREECDPVVALPRLRTLNFTGPVWCTAAVLRPERPRVSPLGPCCGGSGRDPAA